MQPARNLSFAKATECKRRNKSALGVDEADAPIAVIHTGTSGPASRQIVAKIPRSRPRREVGLDRSENRVRRSCYATGAFFKLGNVSMRQNEPSMPLGIRLIAYTELEKVARAFARGDLNLLILLGSHGLGKSRVLRRATAGQACWLQGNTSPFGLYCELWRNQNRPFVLDDLDGLYASREGICLLKCLTQTELQKRVSWHTDAATLLREEIPREFRTTSHVAIITNEWKTLNRNVAALQDRGHVVIFDPSPLEVHLRTAEWFRQRSVYILD